jgi:hypothetical protein
MRGTYGAPFYHYALPTYTTSIDCGVPACGPLAKSLFQRTLLGDPGVLQACAILHCALFTFISESPNDVHSEFAADPARSTHAKSSNRKET